MNGLAIVSSSFPLFLSTPSFGRKWLVVTMAESGAKRRVSQSQSSDFAFAFEFAFEFELELDLASKSQKFAIRRVVLLATKRVSRNVPENWQSLRVTGPINHRRPRVKTMATN